MSKRRADAFCGSCEQMVGVLNEGWNRLTSDAGSPYHKLSRHHDATGRWCIGSGAAIPAVAVMDKLREGQK